MARMHHRLGLVVALGLTTLTTGCAVSQEKYNALKLDRDRLAEQLGSAQNQASIEADLRVFVQDRLNLDTDELTHRCEQAIRNYDPCISCATHFLRLTVEGE